VPRVAGAFQALARTSGQDIQPQWLLALVECSSKAIF
jgi:hypothetical protein